MLERVGRYRIDNRVGEGAMADVYRAYDPSIDRPLAIKLLKREFLADRQYADRFLREARAAGALSHPNIVTIYDVGEIDGTPYIVMELLEGRPLDQLLAAGAMSPEAVLGIGIQLADALAFAHAQGVIHRDIKPSNIIISPDGRGVKLLDFGIARVGDALFEAESVRTQVGQVLGTPRYMSPEQALGEPVDGRSDLFSVGVLLYEMLSGRRAFPGASSATLAIQIVQRDPEPIGTVAPATPGGLQFIVTKLLAKDPARRFQDGAQLSAAMRKELSALTAVEAETRARRSYLPIQVRLPVLLGVITALLLAAAIGTVLWQQYRAMEQVALASGNAISSFVANNAGLRAVENATLPPAQQDWAPVEAFVRQAGEDPAVRRIVVVGADGVVRASSDPRLTGRPYAPRTGGSIVERTPDVTVASIDGTGDAPGAFRFVRPIRYAGRDFGQVEVEVSREALDRAARLAQLLMAALGLVTLGGVALTSYVSARLLASPIRRLREALGEAARGNLDFRISHNRRDEFGELFDGFNVAAGALQERFESIEAIALEPASPAPAPHQEPAPYPEPSPTRVEHAHDVKPQPSPAAEAVPPEPEPRLQSEAGEVAHPTMAEVEHPEKQAGAVVEPEPDSVATPEPAPAPAPAPQCEELEGTWIAPPRPLPAPPVPLAAAPPPAAPPPPPVEEGDRTQIYLPGAPPPPPRRPIDDEDADTLIGPTRR